MTVEHVEARAGAYADSVTLMQVSRRVADNAGVEAAFVAMATDLNVGLLTTMGFVPPETATANDLLIAIRARDDDALAAALRLTDEALRAPARSPAAGPAAQSPRTVGSAVRPRGPDAAGLALISVPGEYATVEALDALESGCDVMIFSDNVPLEHEVLLKDRAAARGLLVMGPDCGTALVSGAGLGFSNTVRPGPIGIVAASGTGAQQLMCLFDESGTGVSAVLGVGGRDLSAAVGGRAARAALALLDADPGTELIVLVSKPPAPDVADAVQRFAAELATPVEFALIGGDRPDLTAAAERVLTRLGTAVPHWRAWRRERPPVRPGHLRGLFAGGTLCDEAMVIAVEQVGPVGSNIPLRPQWRVDPHHRAQGHVMIDFGDDELTAGRPHPMIDPTLRTERLAAELDDPDTAVVLLDVVLGHAAHPDPAADLAPVIASAPADAAVVVTLVGADGDPQRPQTQAAALHAAGADVFTSNAVATRHALALLAGRPT